MAMTDYSRSVPCREVTDRNGRVYRIGENDAHIDPLRVTQDPKSRRARGENNNATNYGTVHGSKLVPGLVGCGLGAVVVGEWDHHGAFVLAGSIGLASAVLALFLKAPGRPGLRRIVPNPHPLGEEMA